MREKLYMFEDDPILDVLEDQELGEVKNDYAVHGKTQSRLDKLIFEALSVHGNNQFKRAVCLYSKVLGMKPPLQMRSIIYNHRGMVFFALSEYQKSISDFTQALSQNNKNFSALNNRVLAYRMLHKYEKALRDFDRSLEINAYQVEGYYG